MDSRISWSPQQEIARTKINKWRQTVNRQVFKLQGYAGTGKTEIASSLADDGSVLFAAVSGKAAHVLSQRIGRPASTIHRTIYHTPTRHVSQRALDLKHRIGELRRQLGGVDSRTRARFSNELAELDAELRQIRKDSRLHFTLNSESPLATAKLLVADEVSMVDERLGRDLLSFHKPILALGDPAQLPPIEGCDSLMVNLMRC